MGLCRALNLILGVTAGGRDLRVSLAPGSSSSLYIAGITSLSRGEVKGGTGTSAIVSGSWLAAALVLFLVVVMLEGLRAIWCLPFVAALLSGFSGRFGMPFVPLRQQTFASQLRPVSFL